MKKILWITGILGLGAGVYFYYKRQWELLKNISYQITGISIAQISPLKLNISTTLTNKSELSFILKGYDIDISINDIKVANVQNRALNQKVNAFGGKSEIDFVTSVNAKDLGIGIQSLLSGAVEDTLEQSNIRFKGKISVKRGYLEFSNYKVDILYKLDEFL